MLEKPDSELSLVGSNEPLPTVEVEVDSIPETYYGYDDIVADALKPFASSNPSARAMIYVYQGMSVNFQSGGTWSAFFGVAGSKSILNKILNAFNRISGTKARLSDYISPSTAIAEFHVQDGTVWRIMDKITWYTEMDLEKSKEQDLDDDLNRNSADDVLKEDSLEEENSESIRASFASRFKCARSDRQYRQHKENS